MSTAAAVTPQPSLARVPSDLSTMAAVVVTATTANASTVTASPTTAVDATPSKPPPTLESVLTRLGSNRAFSIFVQEQVNASSPATYGVPPPPTYPQGHQFSLHELHNSGIPGMRVGCGRTGSIDVEFYYHVYKWHHHASQIELAKRAGLAVSQEIIKSHVTAAGDIFTRYILNPSLAQGQQQQATTPQLGSASTVTTAQSSPATQPRGASDSVGSNGSTGTTATTGVMTTVVTSAIPPKSTPSPAPSSTPVTPSLVSISAVQTAASAAAPFPPLHINISTDLRDSLQLHITHAAAANVSLPSTLFQPIVRSVYTYLEHTYFALFLNTLAYDHLEVESLLLGEEAKKFVRSAHRCYKEEYALFYLDYESLRRLVEEGPPQEEMPIVNASAVSSPVVGPGGLPRHSFGASTTTPTSPLPTSTSFNNSSSTSKLPPLGPESMSPQMLKSGHHPRPSLDNTPANNNSSSTPTSSVKPSRSPSFQGLSSHLPAHLQRAHFPNGSSTSQWFDAIMLMIEQMYRLYFKSRAEYSIYIEPEIRTALTQSIAQCKKTLILELSLLNTLLTIKDYTVELMKFDILPSYQEDMKTGHRRVRRASLRGHAGGSTGSHGGSTGSASGSTAGAGNKSTNGSLIDPKLALLTNSAQAATNGSSTSTATSGVGSASSSASSSAASSKAGSLISVSSLAGTPTTASTLSGASLSKNSNIMPALSLGTPVHSISIPHSGPASGTSSTSSSTTTLTPLASSSTSGTGSTLSHDDALAAMFANGEVPRRPRRASIINAAVDVPLGMRRMSTIAAHRDVLLAKARAGSGNEKINEKNGFTPSFGTTLAVIPGSPTLSGADGSASLLAASTNSPSSSASASSPTSPTSASGAYDTSPPSFPLTMSSPMLGASSAAGREMLDDELMPLKQQPVMNPNARSLSDLRARRSTIIAHHSGQSPLPPMSLSVSLNSVESEIGLSLSTPSRSGFETPVHGVGIGSAGGVGSGTNGSAKDSHVTSPKSENSRSNSQNHTTITYTTLVATTFVMPTTPSNANKTSTTSTSAHDEADLAEKFRQFSASAEGLLLPPGADAGSPSTPSLPRRRSIAATNSNASAGGGGAGGDTIGTPPFSPSHPNTTTLDTLTTLTLAADGSFTTQPQPGSDEDERGITFDLAPSACATNSTTSSKSTSVASSRTSSNATTGTGTLRKSILKTIIRSETNDELLRRIFRERLGESDLHLPLLKKGCLILKFNTAGKPIERWFKVSADGTELCWGKVDEKTKQPSKSGLFNRIKCFLLADVTRIRYGSSNSKRFSKYNLSAKSQPWMALSIYFPTKTLDLVCRSQSDINTWYHGIQALIPLSTYYLSKPAVTWKRAGMKLKYYAMWQNIEPAVFLEDLLSAARADVPHGRYPTTPVVDLLSSQIAATPEEPPPKKK